MLELMLIIGFVCLPFLAVWILSQGAKVAWRGLCELMDLVFGH